MTSWLRQREIWRTHATGPICADWSPLPIVAGWPVSIEAVVRRSLTIERLDDLMHEIAGSYRARRAARVFIVGGGTAVHSGWRNSTIDADLYSDDAGVFDDIQSMKERLQLNIEFARPENFVPALRGSEARHRFIKTIGKVSFLHYDPYAQMLSKIVRGFRQDLLDAQNFLSSGMVDPVHFRSLVYSISETEFQKYPALSRDAVLEAVDDFLEQPALED